MWQIWIIMNRNYQQRGFLSSSSLSKAPAGPLSRAHPAAAADIPHSGQPDRLPALGSKVLFFFYFDPFFVIQNVPQGFLLREGRRGSAQDPTKPSILPLNAQARLGSFQPSWQKFRLPKRIQLPGK